MRTPIYVYSDRIDWPRRPRWDLSQISKLPDFVQKLTTEYPEVDAVIVSAGIQYVADFSKLEDIKLQGEQQSCTFSHMLTVSTELDAELDLNYRMP